MRAPEQLGPYTYRQSDTCFPLGRDTLLLGEFATLRRGGRVCDLGCGAGALPLLLLQFLLTEGVFRAARIGDRQTLLRTVVYAGVMAVLFVTGYVVQRRWVFAGKRKERKD